MEHTNSTPKKTWHNILVTQFQRIVRLIENVNGLANRIVWRPMYGHRRFQNTHLFLHALYYRRDTDTLVVPINSIRVMRIRNLFGVMSGQRPIIDWITTVFKSVIGTKLFRILAHRRATRLDDHSCSFQTSCSGYRRILTLNFGGEKMSWNAPKSIISPEEIQDN